MSKAADKGEGLRANVLAWDQCSSKTWLLGCFGEWLQLERFERPVASINHATVENELSLITNHWVSLNWPCQQMCARLDYGSVYLDRC